MSSDAPYELPLFPLGMVLFPTLPLRLRIFEERYKKMIRRCLESSGRFGVVLIREGMEAHGPLARIHSIGCEAVIQDAKLLPEGRFHLFCAGMERIRILEENRDGEYLSGTAERFPFEGKVSGPAADLDLPELILEYINLHGAEKKPALGGIEFPDDPLERAFLSTEFLRISRVKKQALLEIPGASDFILGAARTFRHEIHLLEAVRDMKEPPLSGDSPISLN